MDQTLHETASSSHPRPVNTWRHWIPIGFSLAMQWGWAIWWGGWHPARWRYRSIDVPTHSTDPKDRHSGRIRRG